MTRNDYIGSLRRQLSQLPQSEIDDIILDYEEHFDMAMSAGKTEDEVCASLGNPETIARQFKATQAIRNAEESKSTGNLLRAIIMTISLSFFNIVFILGPFLAVCGIIMAMFAVGLSLMVAGFAVALVGITGSPLFMMNIPAGIPIVGLLAMGIVLAGVGFLIVFVMIHISRVFYDLVIRYLKGNVSLIKR